jgi:hypothetical protein
MKLHRFLGRPILYLCIFFILSTALRGSNSILPYAPPPVTPYTVTITSDSWNLSVTAAGTDLVGLQSSQIVYVTVNLIVDIAGDTITVEPLDGGSVISGSNQVVVANDGTASFTFQAGSDPGAMQLRLTDDGAEIMGVQLWVLDPNNPGNNPPVVNNF